MSINIISRPMARLRRAARRMRVAALVGSVAVGCDQLDRALSVESPSRLPAENLESAQNANLLVKSAAADFQCALGAYIVAGGLMSGEFVETTQTASRWSYDRRRIDPSESQYSTFGCSSIGVYTPVSTARWTADNAYQKLSGWTDAQVANRQQKMGQTALYAGFSLIILGEGFCSAAVDLSAELQPAELFAMAESRFTNAIAAGTAAGDSSIIYAALVGRARSRINRGDKAGAATDAARVPIDFVYVSEANAAAGRMENRVFSQNNRAAVVTVAPSYRRVTYLGIADPRVRVNYEGKMAANATDSLFTQQKFLSLGAPIPIATGVETQLILAEARGGAEAVAIINRLHSRAGLPPFASTDPATIMAQVIEERRRELFVQGHRLYDANRFNLPFDPPVGAPYPKGGSYGDQRCMPLPDVERLNNPNIPDA